MTGDLKVDAVIVQMVVDGKKPEIQKLFISPEPGQTNLACVCVMDITEGRWLQEGTKGIPRHARSLEQILYTHSPEGWCAPYKQRWWLTKKTVQCETLQSYEELKQQVAEAQAL